MGAAAGRASRYPEVKVVGEAPIQGRGCADNPRFFSQHCWKGNTTPAQECERAGVLDRRTGSLECDAARLPAALVTESVVAACCHAAVNPDVTGWRGLA